jgi:hypothetical protein
MTVRLAVCAGAFGSRAGSVSGSWIRPCWRSFASVDSPLLAELAAALGTLTFNWDDPLPSAENPADKRLRIDYM